MKSCILHIYKVVHQYEYAYGILDLTVEQKINCILHIYMVVLQYVHVYELAMNSYGQMKSFIFHIYKVFLTFFFIIFNFHLIPVSEDYPSP